MSDSDEVVVDMFYFDGGIQAMIDSRVIKTRANDTSERYRISF